MKLIMRFLNIKKYYNWDKEKILFTDGALTWLKKESPEPDLS